MKNPKLLLLSLVIIFALGAGFGVFRFLDIRSENQESEEISRQLQEYIATPAATATARPSPTPVPQVKEEPSPAPEPTPVPDDTKWPEVDFPELLKINEDVAGWIHIENTNISYPILQGEDNQEYLNKLIDGEENRIGSIYIDYRNEKDFSDKNTVIYGHHLAVGTMFSELFKFKEEEFFRENDSVLIMTPDGNFKVRIFAVCIADLNESAWDVFFDSDTQFLAWINDRRSHALYIRDIDISAEDRVVSLSTCSYEFDDARLVVMGLIE